MAKYNIYAVGYGINPKTKEPVFGIKCTTWDECQKYIKGVQGAKYKGFLTDSEADAWIQNIKDQVTGDIKEEKSDWKEKADKIYAAKLHPVDEEFMVTCQELGLPIHETEHIVKMMFINIVKYLKDNDCINELPRNY